MLNNTILALILLAFGFSACNSTSSTEPKTLEAVKTLLQSKKAELQTLQTEIAQLEKRLGELDTTLREEKKVLITTKKLQIKPFASFVELQGNVMTAEEPATASSETGGRIIELRVKEGDLVKKGDLIATVNLESIQKSMEEIDKALELATDIFKRQENLWKQNIGSEVQYLQAKNQVESLQKSKERLGIELKKANVYAPASGYIDRVMSKSGEVCGPGSPIVMILNTTALKVRVAVPETYLPSVRRGESVQIKFPALGEEGQMARIHEIGRTINPANRTFDVDLLIDSRGGLVKPNLMAIAYLKDFERKEALVIPQELVLQDVSGRDFVMLKAGDRAEQRFVNLNRSYQNQVLIDQGLNAGELLIVKGARQVVTGDLVQVIGEEDQDLAERKTEN